MRNRKGIWGAAGALAGILLVAACSAPGASGPDMSRFVTGGMASPPPVSDPSPAPGEMDHVNAMDRQFVKKASQANLEEVALGELAVRKASTESVKAFGQRMVTDHGKAQQELLNAVHEANLEPPMELPPEAKATMQRLEKLSGKAFDVEFMTVMVKGHEKAVKLFTMEAEKGKHPALTGYATKSLPVLKSHLSQAESILAKLK